MSKIIERKLEQAALKESIDNDKSELIALYGRRIGKTFLIREYFKNNLVFEMSGLFGGSLKDQLETFSKELVKRTKRTELETAKSSIVRQKRITRGYSMFSKATRMILKDDLVNPSFGRS